MKLDKVIHVRNIYKNTVLYSYILKWMSRIDKVTVVNKIPRFRNQTKPTDPTLVMMGGARVANWGVN